MKILIVKTSSLGDVIHAFPVLQYLRSCYPQAQIDWVIEQPFAELVQAHPAVNQTIPVHTKKWRKGLFKKDSWIEMQRSFQQIRQQTYHVALDLQGNIKSGLIMASVKSSLKVGFGWASVAERPNLLFTHRRYDPPPGKNIREDYLFLAQSVVGDFSAKIGGVQLKIGWEERKKVTGLLECTSIQNGLKVMICPGSNWANKQLSKESLKNFLTLLLDKLSARFLFVWGSPGEKEVAQYLAAHFPQQSVVVERLALATLQNLMAHVQLVIAMDSLPLHLAGTTSTPTYGIFGASLALKYQPIGISHQAFQGPCPYGKKFEKRCPLLRSCTTGKCIKDIEAAALFNHFSEWWAALGSSSIDKR